MFLGRVRFRPPPLRGCPQGQRGKGFPRTASPTPFGRPSASEEQRARFTIGINKSLLSRYIYGIKRPSDARTRQILDAIRALGREMADI